MGKSISSDLRVRIVGEIESGHSCRAAARRFGVSAATAVRLAQRKARTGSITPERQGRPPGRGPLSAHADVLISWVDAEGDITMPELADRLFKEHGVKAHPAFLSRLLLAHGFTVKKTLLASETDRADIVRARRVVPLSAALQSRPEPNRDGVRQTQGAPAQSKSTQHR